MSSECFGYLEKIQHLLETTPAENIQANTSYNTEDILNGDRSWEKALPNLWVFSFANWYFCFVFTLKLVIDVYLMGMHGYLVWYLLFGSESALSSYSVLWHLADYLLSDRIVARYQWQFKKIVFVTEKA